MLLGAIADDVTGATDLASVMLRSGCRVVQTLGIPSAIPPAVDAIVVATKIRTAPIEEALRIVRDALDFLQAAGAGQIFFKYCSTFDSTAEGNIGPIAEYLMDRLGCSFTVACPSYPTLRRTVYQGHLFVGDRLLSESSMRNHPLTPMRDSDLVRVLGEQAGGSVALADLTYVEAGPDALRERLCDLADGGARFAVIDAILDPHLDVIAHAVRDMPLVTGGAALGGRLAGLRTGGSRTGPPEIVRSTGPVAVLSGSCSSMTLAQVGHIVGRIPSYCLDPLKLAADPQAAGQAIEWALAQARTGDLLVYSSADPGAIARAQSLLGRVRAAASLEQTFAAIARALSEDGVRKFVVAGGETSGSVTTALGVTMMTFGAEIAPGVPLTYTHAPDGYTLALKSGNFGERDFFERALEVM